MARLAGFGERFPERELEVHRLYARSEKFRDAFDDYEDAQKAFGYWQRVANDPSRASEYREIAGELETEILALLDAARVSHPPPDGTDAN